MHLIGMCTTPRGSKISVARSALAALLLTLVACCQSEEIPRHIDKLYSSQAKERNEGALALARCGVLSERAVPRLAALLYDENVGVQSSAAYALRKIDSLKAREVLERAEARRRRR